MITPERHESPPNASPISAELFTPPKQSALDRSVDISIFTMSDESSDDSNDDMDDSYFSENGQDFPTSGDLPDFMLKDFSKMIMNHTNWLEIDFCKDNNNKALELMRVKNEETKFANALMKGIRPCDHEEVISESFFQTSSLSWIFNFVKTWYKYSSR